MVKLVRKTATLAVFLVVALACVAFKETEARGLRPDAIHRSRLAQLTARRGAMVDKIQDTESVQSNETQQTSFLRGVMMSIGDAISDVSSGAKKLAVTAGDAIHDTIKRKRRGPMAITDVHAAENLVSGRLSDLEPTQVCLGGICGISLLILSLWAMLAVAVIVIYLHHKCNKRYHSKTEREESPISTSNPVYYQGIASNGSNNAMRRRAGKIVQ